MSVKYVKLKQVCTESRLPRILSTFLGGKTNTYSTFKVQVSEIVCFRENHQKTRQKLFCNNFFMPEIILGHFADQRRLSIFNLLCKASLKTLLESQFCSHTKSNIAEIPLVVFKKKYDNEQKICKNHYTTKMFMKYVLCNICGGF